MSNELKSTKQPTNQSLQDARPLSLSFVVTRSSDFWMRKITCLYGPNRPIGVKKNVEQLVHSVSHSLLTSTFGYFFLKKIFLFRWFLDKSLYSSSNFRKFVNRSGKMLKYLILTILAIELCGCVQVTSLKTSNNGIYLILIQLRRLSLKCMWNLNTMIVWWNPSYRAPCNKYRYISQQVVYNL